MKGCGFHDANRFIKSMADWEKEHEGHEKKEIPVSTAPTYFVIEVYCVPCKKGIITSKLRERKAK